MRILPSALAFTALALALGCASEPVPTVSEGAVTQRTWGFWAGTGPQLLVLAVDDGPSARAEALREAFVTKELRPMLRRFAQLPTSPKRASEWWPLDVTVVVVHPSQPTNLALALHRLHVSDVDDDAFEAWAASIAADVRAHVAAPGARYAPIERAVDAERVTTGWRLPEGDAEAKAVAELPDFGIQAFAYVTTRDDDGAEPPTAFLPPPRAWWEVAVRHDCDSPPLPRFAQIDRWAKAELSLAALGCPVDASSRSADLFEGWEGTSPQGRCPFWDGRRVARDPDGRAQCRLVFTAPRVECTSARGWMDPRGSDGVRTPTWNADGNRVCEVRLLGGAAADGCARGTVALDAGWCIEPGTASTGTASCDPLGFTRNALPSDVTAAVLELQCDLTR